ncbi:MAG: peptidoglycan-binding protein [Oscillospiraceae bacterium]
MLGEPFIPQNIVVHTGTPDSNAENLTVPFPDYIKNVASSEIFPTWPENAIRANVYAIISYTLNRIYTEWYRSKGYDFDITSSTQYDQSYVPDRDVFDSVSVIVDELFNDYIVKQGSVEPYFTAFCDGKRTTCDGLSQWGTVALAEAGKTPYEILQTYYGNNINIVSNAPVRINSQSYPGEPLYLGNAGEYSRIIQTQLNRISTDYPAIPKIYPVNGVFGVSTENAVKKFQEIFNLPQTGVVDKATWYKIGYLYTSVKKLSELNSEGVTPADVTRQYVSELSKGMEGYEIKILQYYLAVVGAYYNDVMPAKISGVFDDETVNSVKSFQKVFGLPQTGVVNQPTWNDLYRAYAGIVENVPLANIDTNIPLYPGFVLSEGMKNDYVKIVQQYLTYINSTYPEIPAVNTTGYFGSLTKKSILAFQKKFGLPLTGNVDAAVWDKLSNVYSDLRFGYIKRPEQSPGYVIKSK